MIDLKGSLGPLETPVDLAHTLAQESQVFLPVHLVFYVGWNVGGVLIDNA